MTNHEIARQLYEARAPYGIAVDTKSGVFYYHVIGKGATAHPMLTKGKRHSRITWHNCYSYAFDDYELNLKQLPYPGEKSGVVYYDTPNCKDIIGAVLKDQPDYVFLGRTYASLRKIPKSADAVYLIVSSERDYHFYKRRHGVWSHKPGVEPISTEDASKRPIRNPDVADHNYHHVLYDKPCGYFARITRRRSARPRRHRRRTSSRSR